MDHLIALLFTLLCFFLLNRMLRSRDVIDLQLGIISAFSIGYYCLPVWFKSNSPLANEDEYYIAQAVLISFLFGLFLTFGTWIGRKLVPNNIGFKTSTLDIILIRRRKLLTSIIFIYYLFYYFTQDLTSYTSQDIDNFFNYSERGPFAAIMATMGQLALGWIALIFALSIRMKRKKESFVFGAMLSTCIILLLFVGQRLALMTPIIITIAAFAITSQTKKSIQILITGVIVLFLISPISVFIRENIAQKSADNAKEAVASFNYGETPLSTMLQSIIDRADLIYVTAKLLDHIDSDPIPGVIYYSSVPLTLIPRVFFPGGLKPIALSTNGLPSGELSVYAWNKIVGNGVGSLTAFGGIVAYRELGWAGVILNGLLTGTFFVFIARWLGQGSFLPALFYTTIFSNITVMKVPPSLWEAVLILISIIPLIILAYITNRWFSRYRKTVKVK